MASWDPTIAVAGLVVGIVVGLTGMGGGALMTPILVFFFGVSPLAAVSSDVVAYLNLLRTRERHRHADGQPAVPLAGVTVRRIPTILVSSRSSGARWPSSCWPPGSSSSAPRRDGSPSSRSWPSSWARAAAR